MPWIGSREPTYKAAFSWVRWLVSLAQYGPYWWEMDLKGCRQGYFPTLPGETGIEIFCIESKNLATEFWNCAAEECSWSLPITTPILRRRRNTPICTWPVCNMKFDLSQATDEHIGDWGWGDWVVALENIFLLVPSLILPFDSTQELIWGEQPCYYCELLWDLLWHVFLYSIKYCTL